MAASGMQDCYYTAWPGINQDFWLHEIKKKIEGDIRNINYVAIMELAGPRGVRVGMGV